MYYMQKQSRLQNLSRLRQALRQCLKELESSLEVVFGRAPLVKGNVYEMARKCGKPSCTCTRGELHRSMVLSWSERGKTRLFSIPADRLAKCARRARSTCGFAAPGPGYRRLVRG